MMWDFSRSTSSSTHRIDARLLLIRLSFGRRYLDHEERPFGPRPHQAQPTVMVLFHHPPRKRQPEPPPALTGAVAGLEDLLQGAGLDSLAVVLDLDRDDALAGNVSRPDLDH